MAPLPRSPLHAEQVPAPISQIGFEPEQGPLPMHSTQVFVVVLHAGVVPVHTIDGRTIGEGRRGPMVARLQSLYRALVARDVAARRAPA